MQHLLPFLIIFLYLSAAYLFNISAKRVGFSNSNPKYLEKYSNKNFLITNSFVYGICVFICAILLHIYLTYLLIFAKDLSIINLSVFNVISTSGIAVALVTLPIIIKNKIPESALMLCIIETLLVLASILFPSQKPLNYSTGAMFHISSAICSFTTLTVGFLHGILYTFIFRRLKSKKLQLNSQFSLSHLERLTLTFVVIGTLLLILSISSGLIFMHAVNQDILKIKMPFTIASALCYIEIIRRYFKGKDRAMAAVKLTFLAYILLCIGYVIANIIFQFWSK